MNNPNPPLFTREKTAHDNEENEQHMNDYRELRQKKKEVSIHR